jgi:hypothetical protein
MAVVARPQRRPVVQCVSLGIKNDLGSCCRHIAPPCAQIYADDGCQGPVSKACSRVAPLSLCQYGFGRLRPDAGGRKLCSDCSNDATSYPEDSFENMKRFAKAHDFPFPYLHDGTQTVDRGMERFVRRTSSDTMPTASSSIAARSRKAAQLGLARGGPESLSRPCVRSRPPVWRRLTKSRLLAAPSNGGRMKRSPVLSAPALHVGYSSACHSAFHLSNTFWKR